MPRSITVRAVLLDMDGTLVCSHAVVERVWTEWSIANGLDPADVLPHIHGRQAHATMAELLPDRPHEQNLVDNARMIEKEEGDLNGIVAVPGAADLLARITPHPHALVTSAPRSLAEARMGVAGLPLPPVQVMAEDVQASKPDPEGFLRAAALLGVDPASCVVLEDSAAGIAAARAAGMAVVGVGDAAASCDPDIAVADLSTLAVEASPGGTVTLRRI